MNMNEDYISNQIAVYKNSKTLLEFQDKLKVAPINSYAHIHAGGETGADGRRTHSLIGILMKDYSKGTGDKAVTVCANISPKEAKFILSRLTAGFSEYTFQQDNRRQRRTGLCKGIQSADHPRHKGQQRRSPEAPMVCGSGERQRRPPEKCQRRDVHEAQFLCQYGKGICQLKRP